MHHRVVKCIMIAFYLWWWYDNILITPRWPLINYLPIEKNEYLWVFAEKLWEKWNMYSLTISLSFKFACIFLITTISWDDKSLMIIQLHHDNFWWLSILCMFMHYTISQFLSTFLSTINVWLMVKLGNHEAGGNCHTLRYAAKKGSAGGYSKSGIGHFEFLGIWDFNFHSLGFGIGVL